MFRRLAAILIGAAALALTLSGAQAASADEGKPPADGSTRWARGLVTATGPDHAKTFLISVAINNRAAAEGRGASKQKAEAQAAKAALHKLFPNL